MAVAVALAALAAGLASLALFALAIGLVVLTITAAISVALAAGRVTVTRTLQAREVEENAPIHLQFRVDGIKWLPVRLEVEDHAGSWAAIAEPAAVLEVCVSRPGPHWLGPSQARLRDAVGIFQWRLLVGRAEPLLILPAPEGSAQVGDNHSAVVEDPVPLGLTPYVPGTPLARIHWPAYARGAGLHVRQLAPSPGGVPLVVVDTAGASPEALDWTARTAAGCIRALAHDGGCRVLLPGDATETIVSGVAGEWRAMHRRLAMLEPSAPDTARACAPRSGTLHLRAAAAPSGLAPAPPLPPGVRPRPRSRATA